jgi:hypothetical protein
MFQNKNEFCILYNWFLFNKNIYTLQIFDIYGEMRVKGMDVGGSYGV